MSEVMTIVVCFHSSGYRTFKWYYIHHVQKNLRAEFPNLLSYSRFVELMPTVVVPLCAYLGTRRGRVTGGSFIDSVVIEAVSDQLKNVSQIEHSRHRSIFNFMVNIVAALIAYTHQPKKPSIGLMINTHVPVAI